MILYYLARDKKEFHVITLPCHRDEKKLKTRLVRTGKTNTRSWSSLRSPSKREPEVSSGSDFNVLTSAYDGSGPILSSLFVIPTDSVRSLYPFYEPEGASGATI